MRKDHPVSETPEPPKPDDVLRRMLAMKPKPKEKPTPREGVSTSQGDGKEDRTR